MKPTPDSTHANPALQDALTRIYGLHRDKDMNLDLGPGPYRDLLHKLGNPHLRLPPVIHVAGTNGKGSTVAMLRSLIEANGKSVHVFTSPHLFAFNERIRLAGKLITDDVLLNAIEHVTKVNDGAQVTFFEFTAAMALYLFANTPADYCLLETGMGGRLDCTNVIERPIATVITPIGWDHMQYLGDTIEAIASEKAGIMKPDAPCIIAPQHYPRVMPILHGYAFAVGCEPIKAEVTEQTPQPNLPGVHQRDNAATAIACMNALGLPVHLDALQKIDWPGRIMDLVNAPPGWRLVYDGAHNIDSARVLADAFKGEKLTMILGMQASKSVADFLQAFDPALVRVLPVDLLVGHYPQKGEVVAAQSQAAGYETLAPQASIDEALTHLFNHDAPHTVVITGSLYAAQLIPKDYWPTIEG